MRVLLDTNFLIDVVRFKIDLQEMFELGVNELYTLSSVERELIRISTTPSRTGAYAKAALKLLAEHNIKLLKSNEMPDKVMLKFTNYTVATNDTKLRKRLKALGRKTIYLKSRKHLAIG